MKFKQIINSQAFKMCYAQHDAYLLQYILSSTQHTCFDHLCLQNVAFETKFLRNVYKAHFGQQLYEPCMLTTCQIVFSNMVKSHILDRKNARKCSNKLLAVQKPKTNANLIFSQCVKQDDLNISGINDQQFVFKQNLNKSLLLKQTKRNTLKNNFGKTKQSLKQMLTTKKNNCLVIPQLNNARLMSGQWILQYLIANLVGKKSVRPILNNLLREASKLMRTMGSSSPLLGLKLTLTGRLGARKKGMAQQLCRSVGRVPHGSLSQKVDYNQGFINTPLGSVGVKVWVCYA